ncbi:MAG: hypothetical protein R3D87_13825 [Paracoccaceae bacterium]
MRAARNTTRLVRDIFTGMQNIHGPLEWISVQDMGLATKLCLGLVARAAVK